MVSLFSSYWGRRENSLLAYVSKDDTESPKQTPGNTRETAWICH